MDKLDQWTMDELLRENEMLHAENALKLTQILDLEQLIYELRNSEIQEGNPCWCGEQPPYAPEQHQDYCIKARSVTEPFWKKST